MPIVVMGAGEPAVISEDVEVVPTPEVLTVEEVIACPTTRSQRKGKAKAVDPQET